MRKNRIQAYCRRCKHVQVFERVEVHHWLHLILSVLTGGLWAISWIAICIGQVVRPWRCKHCGWHDPVFEEPERGVRKKACAGEGEAGDADFARMA